MPETAVVLPEVISFLADQSLGSFIDGRFVEARSGKRLEAINPATGQSLTSFSASSAADVDAAIASSSAAFKDSSWAKSSPESRAVLLCRLADLIESHTEIIAQIESLDVGKPLGQPIAFDVPNAAKTLRYYADLACKLRYREPIAVSEAEAYTFRSPYGVCGFILPWNFPFLLLAWNIAPALAAGNAVVIKPSEETPLSTLYFSLLAKQAGIPDGVINVVTGTGRDTGAHLAEHSGLARIAFTGSPEVGQLVAMAAAKSRIPCKLELGGKGAAIVFEDMNPEKVAEELVRAVTLNAGQVCCTATRWMVHESLYDRFIESAVRHFKAVRIGDPFDPDTQMGPVVSAKQRDRVLSYLQKGSTEGATTILEGAALSNKKGYFVTPALLAGRPDNVCAREEIFGPVAYVMKFRRESEVIDLVNGSPYGLANSVWSCDLERARRVAESLVAGNSWINAHNVFVHGVPYAGANLSGLGGGVLGPDTLTDYLRPQSIARPK